MQGFKEGSSQLEYPRESSKILERQWYFHCAAKDSEILISREQERKSDIPDGRNGSNGKEVGMPVNVKH